MVVVEFEGRSLISPKRLTIRARSFPIAKFGSLFDAGPQKERKREREEKTKTGKNLDQDFTTSKHRLPPMSTVASVVNSTYRTRDKLVAPVFGDLLSNASLFEIKIILYIDRGIFYIIIIRKDCFSQRAGKSRVAETFGCFSCEGSYSHKQLRNLTRI